MIKTRFILWALAGLLAVLASGSWCVTAADQPQDSQSAVDHSHLHSHGGAVHAHGHSHSHRAVDVDEEKQIGCVSDAGLLGEEDHHCCDDCHYDETTLVAHSRLRTRLLDTVPSVSGEVQPLEDGFGRLSSNIPQWWPPLRENLPGHLVQIRTVVVLI